jgi:drug/metabolite transporter (DMT)-like permease
MNTIPSTAPPRRKFIVAFAALYILWGSTYLAIRISVGTMPPFLMAGSRFLVAGGLLYAWLRLRGAPGPTRLQWKNAAIIGTFLLLGGNGMVCWAEQTVPSSQAALIVAAVPIWFAFFEWVRPRGRHPSLRVILGLIVGFSGTILLVINNSGHSGPSTASLAGTLGLILAGASWAGGSIFSKYHTPPFHSIWMTTAAQMLCGGAASLVVSFLLGEPARFRIEQVSGPSLLAFLYLVIFGSWIGYGAYVWLLMHCAPTKVSTYAYVNPIIATFLGWLVLHEPLTPIIGVAAAIILGGVLLVQWPGKSSPK